MNLRAGCECAAESLPSVQKTEKRERVLKHVGEKNPFTYRETPGCLALPAGKLWLCLLHNLHCNNTFL